MLFRFISTIPPVKRSTGFPAVLMALILTFYPIILFGGCASMGQQKSRDTAGFLGLRKSRPAFSRQQEISPSLEKYLDYYSLSFNRDKYWFGYIDVGDYHCAAHLSLPEGESKGTVLLVHGFLSHFGFFQDLIPLLLENGWGVAGIDLPGHGLSSGIPTHIDDFADYGAAVAALSRAITPTAPRPFAAVGHSMGCAALLEYRLNRGESIRDYIFVAPLVRSTMYGLSQFGFAIFNPLIKTLPRMYQKTSSDLEYLDFQENRDPLQHDAIQPSWVRALFSWNSKIEETRLPAMDLSIIQGDQDKVVDYSYNLKFYADQLEGVRIFNIPGGRHELLKEIEPLKSMTFEYILSVLNGREPKHE